MGRWRKDARGDTDNPLLGEDSASFTGDAGDVAVADELAYGDNHVHPHHRKHMKLGKHDQDDLEPDDATDADAYEQEATSLALAMEHPDNQVPPGADVAMVHSPPPAVGSMRGARGGREWAGWCCTGMPEHCGLRECILNGVPDIPVRNGPMRPTGAVMQ